MKLYSFRLLCDSVIWIAASSELPPLFGVLTQLEQLGVPHSLLGLLALPVDRESSNLIDFGVGIYLVNFSHLGSFPPPGMSYDEGMGIFIFPFGEGRFIKVVVSHFHGLFDLSQIEDILVGDGSVED
jgi:hypothetical protein